MNPVNPNVESREEPGDPEGVNSGEVWLVPAAYMQRRLWFLSQLEPDSPAYNIALTFRLTGRVDHAALERALNRIVQRHESLRTAFALQRDELMQVVAPKLHVPLSLVDLRLLGPEEREVGWRQLTSDEGARIFDLARGPLIRATLVILGPLESVLQITVHHIVFDGWSGGVLVKELAEFYTADVERRDAALTELPIQYGDYAAFQKAESSAPALEERLQYWINTLKGAPMSLDLPTDRQRPAVLSARGGLESSRLSEELWPAIATFSRVENATVFMTLLAAFAAVLHRWSGQDDILVGCPAAGRDRAELEELIGFFVNTFVVRVDTSKNPTFRELVARVRTACREAYAHQDSPFDRLVEALNPERTRDRHPIFQVMFSLDSRAPRVAFAGIDAERVAVHNGTTKCDLTLEIADDREAAALHAEYSHDLFDASTIARLIRHLVNLLTAATANPDLRIDEIELMDPAERDVVVRQWNSTAVNYPAEAMLHTMIEAQAARTPDAVAVECEGQSLTYRELDRRANQLAHRLRALGVGPEVQTGVCLERSLQLIVALYGVLKAGGAYVPLDPEYPAERLAYMLADADAPVLITTRVLSTRLPPGHARTLMIDEEWDRLQAVPMTKPEERVNPDSLAYMIYTSGSTGRPKGALNTHRAIVNRLAWMRDHYGVGTAAVILQKTAISFDVSVWELFMPLVTGARLVFARPGGHRDPAYLIDLIAKCGVTIAHFVPSMLRAFLKQPDVERCRSLELVICSGEGLPSDLRAAFFKRLSCGLHNLYGPTETAVEVTFWDCRHESQTPIVPIGRPIANTQIYILDGRLQPMPIGVPGELYIGGVQVGRGYYNRPDLTVERFIRDPFSSVSTARLYRTGDRCRFLPDGTIEYLGRLDRQVKLRGFRIEPGEVEDALRASGGIRDAAVEIRTDLEVPHLAAYLVRADGVTTSASDLREQLRRRLPEYMVPSEFVFLAELPLTANGKIDRAALPASTEIAPIRRPLETFANEVEAELGRIWSEMLGVPSVGPTDDFFDLGGHSLLAITLFSRIHDQFGRALPIGTLFERPTIRELAALLPGKARVASTPNSTLHLLSGGSDQPPIVLMHGVDGSLWDSMRLAKFMGKQRPVYGLQTLASDESAEVTVETMAAQCVRQIRELAPTGPYHLGGFCAAAKTAIEVARQLRADGQEVGVVAIFDYGLDEASLPRSAVGAMLDFLRNLPLWIAYDLVPVGAGGVIGRLRSRIRIARLALERRLGLRPENTQPDIRDALGMWRYTADQVGVLTTIWNAFESYTLLPYAGRVVLFRPRAERLFPARRPLDLGWGRIALGGVDVIKVPGSHETMLEERFVPGLASRLSGAFDRADAEGRKPHAAAEGRHTA
jgi:amino acid adenylation domain-containing protein